MIVGAGFPRPSERGTQPYDNLASDVQQLCNCLIDFPYKVGANNRAYKPGFSEKPGLYALGLSGKSISVDVV